MDLPHALPLDRPAAEEIGLVIARIEAVDRDLDERGHFGRTGARSLLDHRARLSRELRNWLREFGATPKARYDFAARMASGSVGEEIAKRLAAIEAGE